MVKKKKRFSCSCSWHKTNT